MGLNDIQADKTATLFFDMVKGFTHTEPVVRNAQRLARASRAAGIPVFFAKMNSRKDGSTGSVLQTDADIRLQPWPNGIPQRMGWRNGTPSVFADDPSSEVIAELEPGPADYIVPKYRWSAFYQTYLDLALRTLGIDTIIISGGNTEIGVVATIFAGRDMDYNFIIARDACDYQSQAAHDALMDFTFPRMGRVRTTDQILQLIEQTVQAEGSRG